jgi:ankyrin repeat protein
MKKVTCLHVAAQARRPDNIRLILSKNGALLKLRDKSGKTAMAYACENGDLESIKAFLEHG